MKCEFSNIIAHSQTLVHVSHQLGHILRCVDDNIQYKNLEYTHVPFDMSVSNVEWIEQKVSNTNL